MGTVAECRQSRRDAAIFFNSLVDAVSTPDGLTVFLHAYFDASERPRSGTYCVAGYAFTPAQAKNFAKDWRKMLGPYPYFRTADLLARQGVFKGISEADRDRMMKRAVAIIRERSSASVIALCQRSEIEALAPVKRGLRGPYPVCCHFCMSLLGQWLDKRSPGKGKISYFFESGDEYAGEAGELMNLAASPAGIAAGLDKYYRYGSHTFMEKIEAPPLQSADLLAWEWTKVKDETVDPRLRGDKERPLRRSLKELMGGSKENFLERHLTGTHLKIYYELMEGIDLLPDRTKK